MRKLITLLVFVQVTLFCNAQSRKTVDDLEIPKKASVIIISDTTINIDKIQYALISSNFQITNSFGNNTITAEKPSTGGLFWGTTRITILFQKDRTIINGILAAHTGMMDNSSRVTNHKIQWIGARKANIKMAFADMANFALKLSHESKIRFE
jgi:hypothetical protein